MPPMKNELSIAFIGGGNMAAALAAGLAGQVCTVENTHVIDINQDAHAAWQARGMTTATQASAALAGCRVWIYIWRQTLEYARSRGLDPRLVSPGHLGYQYCGRHCRQYLKPMAR